MTLVEAVAGAEAVLARNLSPAEVDRLRIVTERKHGWDGVFRALDITPAMVAARVSGLLDMATAHLASATTERMHDVRIENVKRRLDAQARSSV